MAYIEVSISHIGVGDIKAISNLERFFNSFTILCGSFTYAIVFGNVASMVSDLGPAIYS